MVLGDDVTVLSRLLVPRDGAVDLEDDRLLLLQGLGVRPVAVPAAQ